MNIIINKRVTKNIDYTEAVYVGRPTIWGNPFPIDPLDDEDMARVIAIRKFKLWAYDDKQRNWRKRVRADLKDKDLVCWCSPEACHAEVLMKIANEKE